MSLSKAPLLLEKEYQERLVGEAFGLSCSTSIWMSMLSDSTILFSLIVSACLNLTTSQHLPHERIDRAAFHYHTEQFYVPAEVTR